MDHTTGKRSSNTFFGLLAFPLNAPGYSLRTFPCFDDSVLLTSALFTLLTVSDLFFPFSSLVVFFLLISTYLGMYYGPRINIPISALVPLFLAIYRLRPQCEKAPTISFSGRPLTVVQDDLAFFLYLPWFPLRFRTTISLCGLLICGERFSRRLRRSTHVPSVTVSGALFLPLLSRYRRVV